MKDDSVCVFGLGYVGLPTAAVFAHKGFNVIGIDVDRTKVELLRHGVSYIREPGLDEILSEAIATGSLIVDTDADWALDKCNIVLVDVPTPVKNGQVDMRFVLDVISKISRKLKSGMLVSIESTIPPNTTKTVIKNILEEHSGLKVEDDFYLAHVPERIAPGKAIEELLNAPRIVGGYGKRSTEKAAEIYQKINPNIIRTDCTTAEFVKLIENTYRDVNIALANLIAILGEKLQIDAGEAIALANTHPRVNIHKPGAGVGGPCLTKDPYMLISTQMDFWGSELIRISRKLNDYMPMHTVRTIKRIAEREGLEIFSLKVAILGVAYKGGVGDTRESPAEKIIHLLKEIVREITVYDPYTRESFGGKSSDSIEEAVTDADILLIVTDHPDFRTIDLEKIGRLMRHRIIFDGRRIIDPTYAESVGFRYYGIGYGKVYME